MKTATLAPPRTDPARTTADTTAEETGMLDDVQFNSLRMGAEMRRNDPPVLFSLLVATAFPGLMIWAALRR